MVQGPQRFFALDTLGPIDLNYRFCFFDLQDRGPQGYFLLSCCGSVEPKLLFFIYDLVLISGTNLLLLLYHIDPFKASCANGYSVYVFYTLNIPH